MSPVVLLLYGVVTALVVASFAVLVGDAIAEWRAGRRETLRGRAATAGPTGA